MFLSAVWVCFCCASTLSHGAWNEASHWMCERNRRGWMCVCVSQMSFISLDAANTAALYMRDGETDMNAKHQEIICKTSCYKWVENTDCMMCHKQPCSTPADERLVSFNARKPCFFIQFISFFFPLICKCFFSFFLSFAYTDLTVHTSLHSEGF